MENKEQISGYCMKCRVKVEMLNPTIKKSSRGTRFALGTCKTCGTKISAMLKKEVA